MNSKELWEFLENSSTEDIQVFVTMSIRYLIMARGLELKNILKDIKKCINNMEV